MKFKVSQEDLLRSISVIKNSKALGKIEDEDGAAILIEAKKHKNDDVLSLTSTNVGIWSGSSIHSGKKEFKDEDDIDLFIENEGRFFLDGHYFINIINSLPPYGYLEFELNTKEEGEKSHLVCSWKSKKKKRSKKMRGITEVVPTFFEERPPREHREEVSISTADLCEAVKGVEFASGTEETKQTLWGIQIEVYDDGIAACATDKTRICWYDKNGYAKREKDPAVFIPIKPCIVAILGSLNSSSPVHVEIGERYTIIKQNDQWHGLPNALQSGEDLMPDWREIIEKSIDSCKISVIVDKQILMDSVKAGTGTHCGKFGLRIDFDSENNEMKCSADEIEDGFKLISYGKDIDLLEDGAFSGEPFIDGFTFSIDTLTDILSKYDGDKIEFKIQDKESPVQILCEKSPIGYMATSLD